MGRFFAITPAPAGANRIRPSGNAGLWNFNSRPREGGESSLAGYPIRARPTSTPAPVWGGELSCLTRLRYPPSRFNSRSRVGEQCTGCRQQRYTRFNSRPRVGANAHEGALAHAGAGATTPAPVWGANSPASPAYAILSVASTHAPCGGEPTWAPRSLRLSSFNSRPRVGANLT